MSGWTWEYVPDAFIVIGGLTPAQVDDVETWRPGLPMLLRCAG
jgi:hypothetical protein